MDESRKDTVEVVREKMNFMIGEGGNHKSSMVFQVGWRNFKERKKGELLISRHF
jgi:hypothetical protein